MHRLYYETTFTMKKYKNKYRIASTRLQGYDYRQNGAYFITICTKDRVHFFGNISKPSNDRDPVMQLNELGELAEKFWMEIPEHFPFVELGNFVVMPNHTHGILIINKKQSTLDSGDVACNVSTMMAKISPKPGSISTIIRSYKSVVTKNARLINPDFKWQARFHDHIIRDTQSFNNIHHYIEKNPVNWNKDKFKSAN